jgi:YHS domain-containing protein
MIRFFFVRLILPLLLILFVSRLLRTILQGVQSAFRAANQPPAAPPVSEGGELKKDPVCGTYVSPAAAIAEKINGRMVYFCSEECRRRGLKAG